MLDAGEQVAMRGAGTDEVMVVFVPDGIGLFRAYINERLTRDD
jgi:hypothetical protein